MSNNYQNLDKKILALFAAEKSREQAFDLLLKTYKENVYYTIRQFVYIHEDADDIAQNVWIKVWKYLGNFRGDSSIKTWLYKICYNESITFLKNKKEFLRIDDDEIFSDHLIKTAAEEKLFSGNQIQQLVQEAIMKLPEKQRIVFTMRYYDETPYEEMSQILDSNVSTLKATYHFARKKVEDYITSFI
jgi:RNA polymerase sigma-70 factor (ECF subfamily)